MRTLMVLLLIVVPAIVSDSGVALTVDTSEAEAVLNILDKRAEQTSVSDQDWQKLFATKPYRRLKVREAAMHREFTDVDFRKFVMSEELLAKRLALKQTLTRWRRADLDAAARRVLAYLPANATIQAKVFPAIKPKPNSFVWEPDTNAAIFLYVDPDKSTGEFENMVAHELHHIGFASVKADSEKAVSGLPPNVKKTVGWMGAFGEGMAMLAAAGSPDVHPHATSKPEVRARWDRDMVNFNRDLKAVEKFFLDVLEGRFKSEAEENEAGFAFFGEQGPWYTVGYKMSALVEKRFGRAKLIGCMLDNRKLLALYNQAAVEQNASGNEQLALWSPQLLKRIGVN